MYWFIYVLGYMYKNLYVCVCIRSYMLCWMEDMVCMHTFMYVCVVCGGGADVSKNLLRAW